MPITSTQAHREAIASVDNSKVFVDTIEVSHSTFPEPYRFARSDSDLIVNFGSGNIIYYGQQFSFSLPMVKGAVGAGLNIKIGGINPSDLDIIRKAIKTEEKILLNFKTFIIDNPSNNGTFSAALSVKDISFDGSDVNLLAIYPDTSNRKVPSKSYNTRDCPGLRT